MNRTIAIAALALAAASSAFAEGPIGESQPFVSTKSRAEVRAELLQYQAAGVNPWARNYDQLAGMRGGKSRAQVTSEFQQSRDEAGALNGEDSGSAWLASRTPAAPAPLLAGQPVNAQ